MEAFSDGVFAIAITLLVLDLVVPVATKGNLFTAFFAEWPQYLAYVVSFATIGAVWLAHSAITENLEHTDSTFLRLNLLLLLFTSFLPFPTRFLAEYIDSDESERAAVIIYGISLLLLTGVLSLLWRYAVGAKLVREDLGDEELEVFTQRLSPGLGGYFALTLVGIFFPIVAVFGFLVVSVFVILPIPFGRRRGGDRDGEGGRATGPRSRRRPG